MVYGAKSFFACLCGGGSAEITQEGRAGKGKQNASPQSAGQKVWGGSDHGQFRSRGIPI